MVSTLARKMMHITYKQGSYSLERLTREQMILEILLLPLKTKLAKLKVAGAAALRVHQGPPPCYNSVTIFR
jgi:hypothetical protein